MSEVSVSDLVLEYLPLNRKKSRSGISINCPMCVIMGEPRLDKRMRGGLKINADGSFVYHCFNCNFSTGHEPGGYLSKNCLLFLETLGVPRTKIPMNLRLLKPGQKLNDKKSDYEHNGSYDVEQINFEEVELPKNADTIDNHIKNENNDQDFLNAVKYIFDRGPMIFDNWTYYWTPNETFKLNKRIIIPFYYEDKIVGWTARYASNKIPENITRYYSETPRDYIFNIDVLNSNQESIILVEGVFDAIAVDGISPLGNSLSEKQIKLLKRSGKEIIIVPDRNKAGKRLVDQAIENGFKISIPDKSSEVIDVADAVKRFGVIYTLEKIYENVISNPNEIKIKFSALCV